MFNANQSKPCAFLVIFFFFFLKKKKKKKTKKIKELIIWKIPKKKEKK